MVHINHVNGWIGWMDVCMCMCMCEMSGVSKLHLWSKGPPSVQGCLFAVVISPPSMIPRAIRGRGFDRCGAPSDVVVDSKPPRNVDRILALRRRTL